RAIWKGTCQHRLVDLELARARSHDREIVEGSSDYSLVKDQTTRGPSPPARAFLLRAQERSSGAAICRQGRTVATTDNDEVRIVVLWCSWFALIALVASQLVGCGDFRGIPTHGGGKRFDEEQRIVAGAIRQTLADLELRELAGKKVHIE